MKPREESQEETTADKFQRTLTMTKDMDDRLRRVCDHLGVTISAYLKQVIGESVSRHEVSLLPAESARTQQAMMVDFFKQMGEVVQAEQQVPSAKRPRKAPSA